MQEACLGYQFEYVKYGNISLNPKVLLHESHMSSNGGEILWYREPYFQSETIPYLPIYNAHFFPAENAPKIEMRIIHRILCFRLASLISM